jgi:CheY-like chemotaxis protein
LVVDDEPDNATIFKIALEDSGFEVNAFNNSTAALSAFKPGYYDLLIDLLKRKSDPTRSDGNYTRED